MKRRTFAVAGLATRYIGIILGVGILMVAICETLAGVCRLVASEREE